MIVIKSINFNVCPIIVERIGCCCCCIICSWIRTLDDKLLARFYSLTLILFMDVIFSFNFSLLVYVAIDCQWHLFSISLARSLSRLYIFCSDVACYSRFVAITDLDGTLYLFFFCSHLPRSHSRLYKFMDQWRECVILCVRTQWSCDTCWKIALAQHHTTDVHNGKFYLILLLLCYATRQSRHTTSII